MKQLFSEIPFIEGKDLSLREVSPDDASSLKELVDNLAVYRYLPTYLFEKKYDDVSYVIRHLYDECMKESIILGIYLQENKVVSEEEEPHGQICRDLVNSGMSTSETSSGGCFCGLIELYSYRKHIHKVSLGYRLLERFWGRGIATEAVNLMTDYLFNETDIRIITASTMMENKASAKVLRKNRFDRIASGIPEDWGYSTLTVTDKWIRLK
ncbi:MAG: GNAT family N-acetyltransferase [Lachnospiraceae bacterium]|nr:GNAT family N-acetyltransferase [Lachnospiraceae bacterium]